MSEDFGDDLITISDEEGNEYTLEHFDTVELDGEFYMACLPADMDEDDEDYGLLIFHVAGDEDLALIEDEELLEEVYNIFMERLFEDGDEDVSLDDSED